MSPSGSLRQQISLFRGAVTLLFVLITATVIVAFDAPISASLALMLGISVLFFLGTTFDRVRAHPLYHLVSALYTAVLFGLWYVSAESDSVFLLALLVLAVAGIAVEAYNYRHGTSYLHLDLNGDTRSP